MECGWDRLVKQIDTAESLEDVIQVDRVVDPSILQDPDPIC